MKINYNCLPCLINQVIKVADIKNASNKHIENNDPDQEIRQEYLFFIDNQM